MPELERDRRMRMRQRVLGALGRPQDPSLVEDFAYGVAAGLTAPGALVSWTAGRLSEGISHLRRPSAVAQR